MRVFLALLLAVVIVPAASAQTFGPSGSTVFVADPNNASYQYAGNATASGTLDLTNIPAGKAPRGVQYNCGSTTPANSTTTLTLSGGGTLPMPVVANYNANQGVSATAATAVTGCTFQALY